MRSQLFSIMLTFSLLVIFSRFDNTLAKMSRVQADTTDSVRTDTSKTVPNLYKNVDVKITYTWNEDEPEWCRNVTCQLVKEKGTVVELKIFRKDCTDQITVKPGLITFEVRDHQTKRLIAKGP